MAARVAGLLSTASSEEEEEHWERSLSEFVSGWLLAQRMGSLSTSACGELVLEWSVTTMDGMRRCCGIFGWLFGVSWEDMVS